MNRSQSGMLTAADSPERLSRMEFFAADSSQPGSTQMMLGHHKNKAAFPSYYQQDALVHQNSTGNILTANSFGTHDQGQGLNSTRFGKGFQRRGEALIANPIKDMRQDYADDKAIKSEYFAGKRTENLKRVDSNAEFNFFSGKVANPDSLPKIGEKKLVDRAAYTESVRSGQIALNEGPGRYFGPFPSGVKQDFRQHVLVNEGIYIPRSTSIIQIGKRDLPSFGIEDQFIKSSYLTNNPETRKGLFEMRLPGAYTPRKQLMHPSANETLVHNWTSSIDINNHALNGKLR